ncbi:MAG TPA: dTMP kinase [Terriglobia bacterium]|nr:dTMP kinase [Terriglobia bacterium]
MKGGRFIVFEGIEGCGKTTQINLFADYLNRRSIPNRLTREPGGTAVGESVRRILLASATTRLTPTAELLLFYASRSQNIDENIRPALAAGEIVIADRFYLASMAYQGFGRGLPLEFVTQLTENVVGDCRPDVTILLDIAPEVGLARARARNNASAEDEGRFEAETTRFYTRVRSGYLELAARDPLKIKVIAADRSIEDVHHDVIAAAGL